MTDPTQCFSLDEELGAGSFGVVYGASVKASIAGLRKGKTCAVKIVQLEDEDLDEYRKEVQLMKQLKHESIVEMFGAWIVSENELWIAMERAEFSVLDVMRVMRRAFPENCIQSVVKQTVAALQYLHERSIVHRDIKAGNLLLTAGGHTRLCDFGVSAVVGGAQKRETVVGSPYWMAPEVIKEVGYATPADIWGLGITAIEMAEMNPPHSEIHPMRVLFLVPSQPPPTLRDPASWSPAFSQFLSACLRKDASKRPPAKTLLAAPWLKKVGKGAPKKVTKFCAEASAAIKRCGSLAVAIDEATGEQELQTEEEIVEALKNMTFSSNSSEVDLSAYVAGPDSPSTFVSRGTSRVPPSHLGTVQLRRTSGTVKAQAVKQRTKPKKRRKKAPASRRDSVSLPRDVQAMHASLREIGLELKAFRAEMTNLSKSREEAMTCLQDYTRKLQALSVQEAWKHPSCRKYIGRIESSREKATLIMLQIKDEDVMQYRLSGVRKDSSPSPQVKRVKKKRPSRGSSRGSRRSSSGSTVKCPACGWQVPPGLQLQFCGKCGGKIA